MSSLAGNSGFCACGTAYQRTERGGTDYRVVECPSCKTPVYMSIGPIRVEVGRDTAELHRVSAVSLLRDEVVAQSTKRRYHFPLPTD